MIRATTAAATAARTAVKKEPTHSTDTPRPLPRTGDATHRFGNGTVVSTGGRSTERRTLSPVARHSKKAKTTGHSKKAKTINLLDVDSDEEVTFPINDFIHRIDMTNALPSQEEQSGYQPPRADRLPDYFLPPKGAIEGIRSDVPAIAIWAEADASNPNTGTGLRLGDRLCRVPARFFRRRYCDRVEFTSDRLHMLRVPLTRSEAERYAKKKNIAADEVPSHGWIRMENISRPPPFIGVNSKRVLLPRVMLRKKMIIAVSLFDRTNSFLRALHHESFDSRFSLIRCFATDSATEDDDKDVEQASRMAYCPDEAKVGITRLPLIHDITDMTDTSLRTRIFKDPVVKEAIELVTNMDELQIFVFAAPRTPVELVQVPVFLDNLAGAATGALGLGNARRAIHYICGTLPAHTSGDSGVIRCFDAVFPDDGVVTLDHGRDCASQGRRPARSYSNRLESLDVSGVDLKKVDCRHSQCYTPLNAIIALHLPGHTVVNGDHHKTQLRLYKDLILYGSKESKATAAVPFSMYEDLLGLPINGVLLSKAPGKRFRRKWFALREHSQFHLRYLIHRLADETCYEALMRNECSFVSKMPRELVAEGLEELGRRKICSAFGPIEPQRAKAEKDRIALKCIEKAIQDVPRPKTPTNLMDYGYAHNGAEYTAHMNGYYYRGRRR